MSKKLKLGERLSAGQIDPRASAYVVEGMPAGRRARIESANLQGTSWRVDHYDDQHGWRLMGEYPTTDEAIAGLEEHLEGLD